MKKRWKSDKLLVVSSWLLARSSFQLVYCLLPIVYCLLASCNSKVEQKHIKTKTADLDGLVQPANQTVFSDVKTILPIQKIITPVLNATGVMSYDPSSLNTISARFSGRIEKLYLRFNFQKISKPQCFYTYYFS